MEVHSCCLRVPALQAASMMLVAVEENPRFSSCLRISDTLLGLVFGAEGVFPLGCWADVDSFAGSITGL